MHTQLINCHIDTLIPALREPFVNNVASNHIDNATQAAAKLIEVIDRIEYTHENKLTSTSKALLAHFISLDELILSGSKTTKAKLDELYIEALYTNVTDRDTNDTGAENAYDSLVNGLDEVKLSEEWLEAFTIIEDNEYGFSEQNSFCYYCSPKIAHDENNTPITITFSKDEYGSITTTIDFSMADDIDNNDYYKQLAMDQINAMLKLDDCQDKILNFSGHFPPTYLAYLLINCDLHGIEYKTEEVRIQNADGHDADPQDTLSAVEQKKLALFLNYHTWRQTKATPMVMQKLLLDNEYSLCKKLVELQDKIDKEFSAINEACNSTHTSEDIAQIQAKINMMNNEHEQLITNFAETVNEQSTKITSLVHNNLLDDIKILKDKLRYQQNILQQELDRKQEAINAQKTAFEEKINGFKEMIEQQEQQITAQAQAQDILAQEPAEKDAANRYMTTVKALANAHKSLDSINGKLETLKKDGIIDKVSKNDAQQLIRLINQTIKQCEQTIASALQVMTNGCQQLLAIIRQMLNRDLLLKRFNTQEQYTIGTAGVTNNWQNIYEKWETYLPDASSINMLDNIIRSANQLKPVLTKKILPQLNSMQQLFQTLADKTQKKSLYDGLLSEYQSLFNDQSTGLATVDQSLDKGILNNIISYAKQSYAVLENSDEQNIQTFKQAFNISSETTEEIQQKITDAIKTLTNKSQPRALK